MHCTHKMYYYYYLNKDINMQDSRYAQRSNPDQSETEKDVSRPKHNTSDNKSTIGRLFVLDFQRRDLFAECGRFRQEGNRIGVPTSRWDSGRC